jgi:hypothetical protein
MARSAAATRSWRDCTRRSTAGKFGKLKISYGYCCKPRASIGFKPVGAPPANLDWNLWRGPAKISQYHANLRALQLALVLGHRQRRHEQSGYAPARRGPLGARPAADPPDPRHGARRPVQAWNDQGETPEHDVWHRRVRQRPARVLQRPQRELQGLRPPGGERVLLRGRRKDHRRISISPRAAARARNSTCRPAKSRRVAIGAPSSPPAAPANPRWPTATPSRRTTAACSAT